MGMTKLSRSHELTSHSGTAFGTWKLKLQISISELICGTCADKNGRARRLSIY